MADRGVATPRGISGARGWRSPRSNTAARYRANDLLGMVVFANTTTISNRQEGEQLFDNFASGAGAGLRLLLNKRSRTNLAFDIGFGQHGNRGVYLTVQEAF